MGTYSRPIVVELQGASTQYIPVARGRDKITVQLSDVSGITAVQMSVTSDNILRGPGNSYDTGNEEHKAPASAAWSELVPNLVAAPYYTGNPVQAFALRFVNTGAGTARVVIQQET